MAGMLETAYAKFKDLTKDQRRELDHMLTYVMQAQMPTKSGEENRAALAAKTLAPGVVKTLAAYRAYKLKLQPPAATKVAAGGVGHSNEAWEQKQLTHFDDFVGPPVHMGPPVDRTREVFGEKEPQNVPETVIDSEGYEVPNTEKLRADVKYGVNLQPDEGEPDTIMNGAGVTVPNAGRLRTDTVYGADLVAPPTDENGFPANPELAAGVPYGANHPDEKLPLGLALNGGY